MMEVYACVGGGGGGVVGGGGFWGGGGRGGGGGGWRIGGQAFLRGMQKWFDKVLSVNIITAS